jgi:hypothetical protein
MAVRDQDADILDRQQSSKTFLQHYRITAGASARAGGRKTINSKRQSGKEVNAMKVGRLISDEGVEFSLDNSQLREFIECLRRQEGDEAIAAELSLLVDAAGFIDPEDYERAAQAAYFARRAKTVPAAA